jgi:membrane-associated protease RseP (regulator of RpoE activity)
VFLLEPAPTPFDLSWRMFGIHVRVHPMFWVIAAVLGWGLSRRGEGMQLLLLWILCVFVSILIHELGHVFMGRLFGSDGHIVLHSFGGLAVGSNDLPSRWQRILVCFAGPLAGFVFLGLVTGAVLLLRPAENPPTFWEMVTHPWWASDLVNPEARMLAEVYGFLFWINLYWGIVNLFPIWPLDGGQISRDVLGWLVPQEGLRASLAISLTVAGGLAVYEAVKPDRDLYLVFFFGLLALGSFQALQQVSASRTGWKEPDAWDRDRDSWDR